MKRRLRPLKKASAWLGHEVRQGTQSYGTIGGFVFDSSRLHFAVTLTGADEGSVLPVRLLDWKEDGVLSVQEGAQPQPLTPRAPARLRLAGRNEAGSRRGLRPRPVD